VKRRLKSITALLLSLSIVVGLIAVNPERVSAETFLLDQKAFDTAIEGEIILADGNTYKPSPSEGAGDEQGDDAPQEPGEAEVGDADASERG
jgi:hypothetical protein